MGSCFRETEIPKQKHYDGSPLPYFLCPNPTTTSPIGPSLLQFISSIKAEKPYLESLLQKSGAVLFRGFPVDTASAFNDVVEAFGYEELPYVGGQGVRTRVIGRVYTANDSPLHVNIGFHHEMSNLSEFPSNLLFFCEGEPTTGGETPMVLSHIVWKRMKECHPDFVQRLKEQGITYTNVLDEEDDPSNLGGRGWKTQFSTIDERGAEERAAKVGAKLEWLEDGVLTILGPRPAIRYGKPRNREIWYNSVALVYQMVENSKRTTLTSADGKPLPREIICDCIRILEEESVAIPWQKGDILLIDNFAVLHGRNSCKPPRRVLASLCK